MKRILLLVVMFMAIAGFAFAQNIGTPETTEWNFFAWANASPYYFGAVVLDEQNQILEEIPAVLFESTESYVNITTTVVGYTYTFYLNAANAGLVIIAWQVPGTSMIVQSVAEGNNVMLVISK